MDKNTSIQFIRPFGHMVAKAKIPEDIIDKLNNYFDGTIKSKEKLEKFDHGKALVGEVTREIRIDPKFAEESGWVHFLSNAAKAYVEAAENKIITKFILNETWIVSQFKHEYNPTHWHTGHLSGAGYIKVPSTFGPSYQNKQEYHKGWNPNGNLQLIHGARQFLSPSTVSIKPELGDFYFFPNYLMHTVFPFRGTEEERRCVSFNASVDENVYNVYSG